MISEKLQPATYRDVPFLVPSEQNTEGRKTATHEFVNSNRRFIEDLGIAPSKFSLTAIVHGSDAIILRDALRSALSQPGIGILIHPTYGRQEVVVEGPYNVSSADTSLGEFRFSITFAKSSAAIFPTPAQNQLATVAFADEAARANIFARLEDQWTIPTTTENLLDAVEKIKDFADRIITTFRRVRGTITVLITRAQGIINTAFDIANSPKKLADEISAIFTDIVNLGTDARGAFDAMTKMFDFGKDDIPIVNRRGLSFDQTQRQLNRGLLNSSVQAAAVSVGYELAASIDFLTVDEVNDTRSQLDVAAQAVIADIRSASVEFDAASAIGIQSKPTITTSIISGIQNLRGIASEFLDTEEFNAFRTVTIFQNLTSARLFAYAVRGNTDLADALGDLNLSQRPSNLSGDLVALNK